MTIAIDAGHWYAPDGAPAYTIIGANGKARATTIRDARKLNLLPSVTEIIKCAAKPGLENWKQTQVMLAAMTLPRLEGESDESFCQRVIADSREQGKKAADRGSALHGAIELHLQGKPYAAEWMPHVEAVIDACAAKGIDLLNGESERSFASAIGFGGKVDWHSFEQGVVIDFKSKQWIDEKTEAYDEHAMQLAAYGFGLKIERPRLLNVFVGVEDARILVHEWTDADAVRGWKMFSSLLSFWQTSKRYFPSVDDIAA